MHLNDYSVMIEKAILLMTDASRMAVYGPLTGIYLCMTVRLCLYNAEMELSRYSTGPS